MKPNSFRLVRGALALVAVMTAVQPSVGAAQRHPPGQGGVRLKPAAEALSLFEQENRGAQPKNRDGAMTIVYVLTHPNRVSSATVDSVVSGLEHLALNADVQRVRAAATSALVFTGDTRRPNPLPGAFARTMRIYRKSRDPLVRATILPILPFYAEQDRVVAFLKSVATQSPAEQDYHDAPAQAVTALTYMGQKGRAALRDLLESNSVRHPVAEAQLRYVMGQKP